MRSPTQATTGSTIAGVASIVVGVVAVVTALYGFEQDPLGTALYNGLRVGLGSAGPILLAGTVAVIGLALATSGLHGTPRWPAIAGVVVNASAVVIAFLMRLAVEHGFGA